MATQIGIVKTLTGEVTATAADGSIRTLQVGDMVYANELISTGQAGAVEIEFADGSIMDLGRSSQAMLDSAVFDPSSAVADASEEDVPDDVAAIQQALLEGEDPIEAGEATAAGAGVEGGNEGHEAVFVDYLNPEVTPDAGFETIGVNSEIDDVEDEQLLDGVPTAGLTVVTLDEDELVEGGSVDLGTAGNEFLNFLNGQGISAFTFDSPNGVGDERPEVGDDPADGYFLSGSLVAAYGLDGPNEDDPISFNAVTGSDVTDSNGNPVTSEGQQVKYWVSADGLTVIGYVAGDSDQSEQPTAGCQGPGEDYPDLAEIIFTAQLTPTEEGGSFLVGIFGQFDHAEPDYANGEFVFEDNLLLNLGFTITDADGDSTTGTLQLDVDDDSPVRAGEGEQLATQTGTVTEDGLSLEDGDLSEGNPNNAVAMTITSDDSDADQSDIESFLGLSAGALEPAVDSNGGSGNATNGSASKSTLNAEAGDIISFNWSFDNNDGGSFNDFAFVVINGEVFELADSNGGDLASNPFTYEVTADGVISIGFGQMNVGDQIVDSSLTVSDLTLNGSPVNGGFDGSLTGWDTLGNVSDNDSLVNSDVTSGNLNTVVNMGADGPGSFGLLQASENEAEQALFQAGMDSLPTLSSKGEAVSYSVMMDGSDSVLVATAGEGDDAREVFTLTIDSDGQWTFDLNDQLDHVAGETAEENFSLITLDENGEPNGSVDSIDFTQLLQIRDFDGDQLIITEDDAGMLSISIQDDIPVATGETVNVSVDEDDIVTDNSTGNDPFDNADDGSYTGEPVTIFGYTTDFFNIFNGGGPATTTGSVSSLVSFGADETGTFSLGDNFAGLEGQGLTSKGDELSFEVNGDTLIASADGRAVFTLELADNGDFTFSLYDQLDHAAGNGENNLPLDLSSVIQATDSDNDTITLENGFVIDVTDDIPEQAGVLPDIGIVEEEALPAGNQEENDGTFFGYPVDGWPDTAVATGSLQDQVSVGADENVTFAFAADLSGLPELTSNGLPVSYEVNGDTLTASTEAGEVFTLTLNSEGDYVFTLTGALDHDAGQGENLEVINFSSIIEATDFDGDTITLDNDFYIKIVDDMPVATGESVSVTVDEDDIQTDNSSGNDSFDNDSDGSYTGEPVTVFGYTTDFFNIFNGGGPATTSGSVATLVSFGADENGTFSLGNDFAALEGQNLTSKGDELSFEVNGDTLVASADGRAVFTLELDDNGDFTFSLYDQLDHATGNGENNLPLDLSSVIQATDSDLDTITLDSGFTIDVTDDVPEYAGGPDLGIVEEEALPAGNQEENDGSFFGIPLDGWPDTAVATGSLQDQVSVGADDDATFSLSGDYTSLIAQNLTSNDVPVTYQLDGDTLTASAGQTPVFTLTLSSNGDYIFTLMGPLDHPESYVEENPLVIDLSGVVIAEDFDGDAITLNNDLFIKIIDDSPEVAENAVVGLDDDALAGGNPGGTGDDANAVNVTGTLSHSFGADGGSISWQTSGAPSGFTYEASGDDLLIKQGGETVLTLSLNPETGEYSVTQNAPIKHQDDGNNDENNQLFNVGYLVTDNDDDTATGSLQINVDDDTPTVEPYEVNTMRIISDDDTVDGLNGNPGEGSNTNDGAGTDSKEYNQSKTLQFSAGADGGTVAWNVDNSSVDDATAGISFSVNGDGSLIITQMQNGVPVEVAEITLDANTGDYNYTQTSNVLHTPGDNENEAAFTLGFTVTDGDGDTADGYLTLLIDDDTPVVTSQQLNLLTESFEDFAPDLSGNNWTVVGEGGGTIIGNNGIEWTVNGAGIEIQSGNVGGASASDGDVHAELDAHDSNGDGGSTLTKLSTEVDLPTADATLSFDFQPRPSDVDGSDMTVSLGGQEVTINVDGSGVIDFGTLPSGVSASQSSSAGGWTTITLSFTGLDTNSAQTLSFEGVGSENTLGAFIDNISLNAVANLTVDESALADGSGEAGASTTASYDFSGFFTGEFGADGPAGTDSESYALNLNGVDVGSGLFVVDNADTSSTDGDGFGQGEEILLNQDGNQIVGSAGGVDYFTISVNDDGEVTLTQLENIWHADTTNPDDSQSMVLDAELLTLVKTITDADQDSAEATLDLGGVNFNFEDDAPAIEAQQPAQPYLLTITNEGGDAGYNNTYGYFIKGENGEPVSGEIIWANVKDNESGEVTVEVTDPSDIGFFIIPDGDDLNDLNNGDAVTFGQDGDGNWQVVLDGEPLTGQGTNVLFNDAALNQDGAQAVEDNAAAGNQNWEDIIGGDNDFNDVNINVSISQLGAITVDETDIGNGDPSNATATLNLSGSFTADFGADGEGDVDYGLSVDTDVNTGLIDTQSGEEVLLRVVDGEVEGYINDGSDQVVFTVTVDSDGEVTLTQLRAVEHDDATDPDEANSPATINAGAISLDATVTDADGDSADASLDLGVLFAFEDDGPVAVDDADSVVDGLAEGNVLTAASTDGESGADSFGADGPGSVTSVTFGNTTYDVPSEGSVDIDGDFGTLTLHSDGSYEYNVNPDNVPQNIETVEGWTNNGSNMTAFNLGESFLDADGKFSDSGNGTVTSGGNTQGFGVAGTSGANTSVPAQVNQSGSESEALAFKFTGDVTSATVQFSNLFNNENGGEAMRWHAFDADGNRIDSGIVSDNDASDPYAGDTAVIYSSNNEGSFTISDIGAFSTLVFEGVPYSNDGSDGADDSDFFVNITSYDVFGTESNQYQDQFTYEITDADGDSDSATLTVNGQSEPEQGELDAIAPVAADNTYQVDGETSGNIITDDDDNGGAETGRDYDNDTPVINLSINSVIVNGGEPIEVTANNTVIGLDNGTLVINLDGSYTYTPNENADGGDEFDYTLVDPDGEVSEPATVTLLEPLVSDVVTLGDVTVNEGDGTATITGSVENAVTGSPLVITLNNEATITIDVGETSGASTPFPVQGDDPYIDGETITLSVTGTDGGNYSSLDTLDTSTVTVNDTIDDVTVVLSATSSTSEDGGSITYTASLVDGDNNPVTTNNAITVTLANGESITIDAGDSSGDSAPVAVNQDDLVLETDSIDNNITGISEDNAGTDGAFENLGYDSSTVSTTITDDSDGVNVVLSATSSTSEDGGSITYTASLVDGDNNPVTTNNAITVTLANGESITIDAGDSSGDSAPVAVNQDDLVLETDSIDNNITGISEDNAGTDGAFENLGYDSSTVSTTITDDSDGVNVVLSATSSTSEDGGSITYTASLVDGDNNPVTTNNAITVTLANGESITIDAGDSSGDSAPVAVNLDDVYVETDSIDNNITGVSEDNAGTDGAFENLGYDDSTVSTTITDDSDPVTATLTTSTTEVDEDGGDITYTITLTGGPGDIDPDADLVFNLANGEQVTISAGDTSGSFTRTYTDAEITNQVSITNSIAGVASGGSEYENLQTAGTTTVDVDYAPEISNLTPAANGGDVTVDEDDLAEGSDTSKESTVQEGTFTISSGDAIDDLTIEGNAIITDGTFSATSFTTALGNTLSVTGYDANTGEITYSYELADNTLTHGPANNGENGVFENLAVSLSDVDGNVANDTLSVQIIDDTPTANPAEASGTATQQVDTNLMLILDVSGSMDDDANFQGMSRLEVMIKSSLELLDQYDAYGDVMVNLVTFSWNGANPTNGWVSVDDAKTILLGLDAGGNTNYDDALNDAINAFGQSGSIPGAQNVSYFMSDGAPNENDVTDSANIPGSDNDLGGGDGISSSEEADWIRFLEFYNIKSYALGMGTGVNEANLNPIAYDGVAETNLDSIVVTNFAELQTTLVGTIEVPPLTGTLLNGGLPASAGADGGYIQSITVDGVTYSFNQQTDTAGTSGGSAGSFDTSTNTWTVTTTSGAELSVDMDTGEYNYAGPDGLTSVLNETFGYVVVDNDGDTANSTLEVTIDPAEGPTVVRDDFVLTNQDPTDIPDWALLANDTGPNSDSQQLTGVSNTNSGNVTDNSDNTVTFDDTGSDDGSFSYTNTAGGQSENGNVYVNQVNGDEIEGSYLDEILVGSDNQSDTLDGNAGNDILIGGDGVTGGPVARRVNADVRSGDTLTSSNNQFGFHFAAGAGLYIEQITMNIGNDGYFDSYNKPFTVGSESTVSGAEVSATNSGYFTQLVMNFSDNSFQAGDTLRFGIDTDDWYGDMDDGRDFGDESIPFTITFSDGMTVSGNYNQASGETSIASVTEADNVDSGMQIDDQLIGGAGDDILVGGGGNDLLTGGDGADTFKWESGDEGSLASPAIDFITDFDSSEGDVLDLADILQGEESNDITNYISVAQDGDDVVINVTPDGAGGDMNQVITLQDTTVDQLAGTNTSGMSQADIINTLINNGQLNVDQS